MSTNLGEKIKTIRLARNLSQSDVAEAMGVSRQYVSRWESGERNINGDQLIEYAKVVGVTMDFFNDEDNAERTLFQTMYDLDKLFTSAKISQADKDKAIQDIMNIYFKSKELTGIVVETPEVSLQHNKAKEE